MFYKQLPSEEYKFYFLFYLAFTFCFAMLMPFSYGDLAIWISEGRQIFAQRTVYIHDVYSFNPTVQMPYPWLSCVFYYFIDSIFGIKTIFFIHRLIPVAIVYFWLSRYPHLLKKRNWPILVVSLSGLSGLFVDRPALLLLPVVIYTYELIESEEIFKNNFKIFLLLILWTNLHGSFVLFFMLLFFKLLTALSKKIFTTHFGTIALYISATLVNPWFFHIYDYVYQTAQLSKIRMTEWQPISFYEENKISFDSIAFSLSVMALVSVCLYRRKLHNLFRSSITILIIFAFNAFRNLPLFFGTLPLFYGRCFLNGQPFQASIQKRNIFKFLLNRLFIFLLIAIGFFFFSDLGSSARMSLPRRYSSKYDETSCFKIAEYLKSFQSKRIFNEWILGSFLIYTQDNKVFSDTRNIIYSDSVMNDYTRIVKNSDNVALKLLKKYSADFVIARSDRLPLLQALSSSPDWTFILDDSGYRLFQRIF